MLSFIESIAFTCSVNVVVYLLHRMVRWVCNVKVKDLRVPSKELRKTRNR